MSEAVMAKADAPGKGADIKVVPCPGPKAEEDPVIRDIAEAAEAAEGNTERIAVVTALGQTPGLTESAIAPDVLAKLLPDDVVVLPELKRVGGSLPYRFAKRAFDVVSCSCALIVLAIPMAAIAIAIKAESPGPVIYAQTRVGKGGRLFKIYKFRSMYTDAEAKGARWAAGDDPRITPLGKKLRMTRLDEILQFWNVVKGDMSIVGPRPALPAEVATYDDYQRQRLLVKPGLTCYWQTRRNRDSITFDEWVDLDLWQRCLLCRGGEAFSWTV